MADVDPLGSGYWDDVAAQTDALPDGWRRHGRDVHVAMVQRWAGPLHGRWLKTDLFEERSGPRAVLPHLEGPGWIGIDVSPAVVAGARRRTAVAGAASDVRALPLRDGVLDGVLSTSTLDHFAALGDIDDALVELRRVLTPGGLLVVTFDNPGNPLIRLRNALPRSVAARTGLAPFSVGCTHDAGSGTAALERAGFRVEAVEHVLHAPHVVGTRLARSRWWERRALPAFDRLGSTRLAPRTGHYVAFLARAR